MSDIRQTMQRTSGLTIPLQRISEFSFVELQERSSLFLDLVSVADLLNKYAKIQRNHSEHGYVSYYKAFRLARKQIKEVIAVYPEHHCADIGRLFVKWQKLTTFKYGRAYDQRRTAATHEILQEAQNTLLVTTVNPGRNQQVIWDQYSQMYRVYDHATRKWLSDLPIDE